MNEHNSRPARLAQTLGICLQGLVLGGLLVIALTEIWVLAEDVQLFRYQSF